MLKTQQNPWVCRSGPWGTQGGDWVKQAGDTMIPVVASILCVSDIVGKINAARLEQSAGVTQVGDAIQQMDSVTQHNAALVEQRAASALRRQGQAAHGVTVSRCRVHLPHMTTVLSALPSLTEFSEFCNPFPT